MNVKFILTQFLIQNAQHYNDLLEYISSAMIHIFRSMMCYELMSQQLKG